MKNIFRGLLLAVNNNQRTAIPLRGTGVRLCPPKPTYSGRRT